MEYFEAGYLPEAMLNYLVRLGWSHGDQEIFSRDEMIEFFTLEGLNKSASSFNTDKLKWINQQYLMSIPLDRVMRLVEQRLVRLGVSDNSAVLDLASVVDLYRQRVATINELVDSILYFFEDFEQHTMKRPPPRCLKPQALLPLCNCCTNVLQRWIAGAKEQIHGVIEGVTSELGSWHGQGGPAAARGHYRRFFFAAD